MKSYFFVEISQSSKELLEPSFELTLCFSAHPHPSAHARQHHGTVVHVQDGFGPNPSSNLSDRDLISARGRTSGEDGARVGQSNLPFVLSGEGPNQAIRGLDGYADQKISSAYNHHRQTSIVNGMHHSRNASLVTSKSNSPLSPQVVSAGLINGNMPARENTRPSFEEKTNSPSVSRQPSISGGTVRTVASNMSSTNTTAGNGNPNDSGGMTQKNPTPSQNGRPSRKDQTRSQAQMRNELKTVGEYALHHLFNSV